MSERSGRLRNRFDRGDARMSTDQARRDALAEALTGVFSLRCWCDRDPRRDACPKHGSVDALMPLLADWAAEERRAGAERLAAVREYVDDPGNWSALDGRRLRLLALIDGGEPA